MQDEVTMRSALGGRLTGVDAWATRKAQDDVVHHSLGSVPNPQQPPSIFQAAAESKRAEQQMRAAHVPRGGGGGGGSESSFSIYGPAEAAARHQHTQLQLQQLQQLQLQPPLQSHHRAPPHHELASPFRPTALSQDTPLHLEQGRSRSVSPPRGGGTLSDLSLVHARMDAVEALCFGQQNMSDALSAARGAAEAAAQEAQIAALGLQDVQSQVLRQRGEVNKDVRDIVEDFFARERGVADERGRRVDESLGALRELVARQEAQIARLEADADAARARATEPAPPSPRTATSPPPPSPRTVQRTVAEQLRVAVPEAVGEQLGKVSEAVTGQVMQRLEQQKAREPAPQPTPTPLAALVGSLQGATADGVTRDEVSVAVREEVESAVPGMIRQEIEAMVRGPSDAGRQQAPLTDANASFNWQETPPALNGDTLVVGARMRQALEEMEHSLEARVLENIESLLRTVLPSQVSQLVRSQAKEAGAAGGGPVSAQQVQAAVKSSVAAFLTPAVDNAVKTALPAQMRNLLSRDGGPLSAHVRTELREELYRKGSVGDTLKKLEDEVDAIRQQSQFHAESAGGQEHLVTHLEHRVRDLELVSTAPPPPPPPSMPDGAGSHDPALAAQVEELASRVEQMASQPPPPPRRSNATQLLASALLMTGPRSSGEGGLPHLPAIVVNQASGDDPSDEELEKVIRDEVSGMAARLAALEAEQKVGDVEKNLQRRIDDIVDSQSRAANLMGRFDSMESNASQVGFKRKIDQLEMQVGKVAELFATNRTVLKRLDAIEASPLVEALKARLAELGPVPHQLQALGARMEVVEESTQPSALQKQALRCFNEYVQPHAAKLAKLDGTVTELEKRATQRLDQIAAGVANTMSVTSRLDNLDAHLSTCYRLEKKIDEVDRQSLKHSYVEERIAPRVKAVEEALLPRMENLEELVPKVSKIESQLPRLAVLEDTLVPRVRDVEQHLGEKVEAVEARLSTRLQGVEEAVPKMRSYFGESNPSYFQQDNAAAQQLLESRVEKLMAPKLSRLARAAEEAAADRVEKVERDVEGRLQELRDAHSGHEDVLQMKVENAVQPLVRAVESRVGERLLAVEQLSQMPRNMPSAEDVANIVKDRASALQSAMKADVAAKVSNLESRIGAVSDRVAQQSRDIQELPHMHAVERHLSTSVLPRLQRLDTQVSGLAADVATRLPRELQELASAESQLANKVADVASQADDAMRRVSALESRQDGQQEQLRGVEGQVKDGEASNEALIFPLVEKTERLMQKIQQDEESSTGVRDELEQLKKNVAAEVTPAVRAVEQQLLPWVRSVEQHVIPRIKAIEDSALEPRVKALEESVMPRVASLEQSQPLVEKVLPRVKAVEKKLIDTSKLEAKVRLVEEMLSPLTKLIEGQVIPRMSQVESSMPDLQEIMKSVRLLRVQAGQQPGGHDVSELRNRVAALEQIVAAATQQPHRPPQQQQPQQDFSSAARGISPARRL